MFSNPALVGSICFRLRRRPRLVGGSPANSVVYKTFWEIPKAALLFHEPLELTVLPIPVALRRILRARDA